jgi:ubiquinone/menaquinone biosynthesis C-methylase UbiE
MSGFWDRHIVPRIIACGCCMPMVMEQRSKVVPLARGAVLEIGCGAGANFGLYEASRVTSVDAIEPSPELLERARDAVPAGAIDFRVQSGVGEALSFADGSFDCVVFTYTLCSVDDPATVLKEARRVLKPGGSLLFLEHGATPRETINRWQRRLDHVWPRLMGNCHLSRVVTQPFSACGFEIAHKDGAFIEGAPRFAGWMEWGEARAV